MMVQWHIEAPGGGDLYVRRVLCINGAYWDVEQTPLTVDETNSIFVDNNLTADIQAKLEAFAESKTNT